VISQETYTLLGAALMDQEAEMAKLKWLLIAGIGFLISGYFSLHELRYVMFAKTAQANVTQVREKQVTGRRGRTRTVLVVDYRFTDATGTTRSENDSLPSDWSGAVSGTVGVQYIPGVENASRIEGQFNYFAVGGFLVCCAGLAFGLYKLVRLANDPPKTYGKRRNK
jgi:hypothetical protein